MDNFKYGLIVGGCLVIGLTLLLIGLYFELTNDCYQDFKEMKTQLETQFSSMDQNTQQDNIIQFLYTNDLLMSQYLDCENGEVG